ncbi:MAG: Arc family DNA-binding protein [Acutalibacteraceae bacterium]
MDIKNFSIRIDNELLDKLYVIAEYEGRSKNREIEQLIKKRIADFEGEHGKIETTENEN